MTLDSIAIADFAEFSKLDRELNQLQTPLQDFMLWSRDLATFESIIQQRKQFPTDRPLLKNTLVAQYQKLPPNDLSQSLIKALESPNTFTVCTAHQPCLFTGPAFVISKIISTIKLARQLSSQYPDYTIIPIFVIGSEDHDVEELSHCTISGKKIQWMTDQKGPVGRYHLKDLGPVIQQVRDLIGSTSSGPELIHLIEQAYSVKHNFALAFQYMLHALLGHHGILILNQDDEQLKNRFKSYILDEVLLSKAKPIVQETQQRLKMMGYDEASHARDINFFYFNDGFRDRIEKENSTYNIIGQSIQFEEPEMRLEIQNHPERFSPNVVMRPVYQEVILPNLAYVGGGGELAYWLERKAHFQSLGVPYPMLVRRDSFIMIQSDQWEAFKKFNLTIKDLGLRSDLFINKLTESLSPHPLDFSEELMHIQKWLEVIRIKALAIDPTLGPSVEAEKSKLAKSIEHIEKKLLKSEKSRLEVQLNRIKKLRDKLMPGNNLMEREENFMTFYADYGQAWIDTLLQDFDPLRFQLKLIMVETP